MTSIILTTIINELQKFKINSIDFDKKIIIIKQKQYNFANMHDIVKAINNQTGGLFSESSSDLFSETSAMNQNGGNYSETSAMNQNGGNYSETSSIRFPLKHNYSETSAMNQNGGNYSETSELTQNSDIFSKTSELKNNFKGGNYNYNNDTLQSITELEDSQLDLDIFKRSYKKQNGGSYDINNKQNLNAIGINSSSTSSICE